MFLFLSFFVFGLIVGSFLNAVMWRMREGMGLGGRSMCPSCRKQIAWYDNIPIFSFLFLQGKCRQCRKPISWRYPVVEFSTGILFALFGSAFFFIWDFDSWVLTAFYLVALSLWILIFLHDLETMEIPNILLWIGVGWSLLMLFFLDFLHVEPILSIWSLHLYSGIFAGMVAFFPFFLLATLSHERWMGLGDGFLGFFLGLVIGWPHILFALFLAFGTGSIVGIALIVFGKKNAESHIPLGPFLIFGSVLVLFFKGWFPDVFDMMLRYIDFSVFIS